jgi:hypothetical protein
LVWMRRILYLIFSPPSLASCGEVKMETREL